MTVALRQEPREVLRRITYIPTTKLIAKEVHERIASSMEREPVVLYRWAIGAAQVAFTRNCEIQALRRSSLA